MEDEKILDLYWQRNEDAIMETDKAHGAVLKATSMRITFSSLDAEECLNTTYLKTWNAIPPERPRYFRAWLLKIIRHLSIDAYRSSKAAKRGKASDLPLDELYDIVSNAATPEENFNAKVLSDNITAFLNMQSERKRALFVSRYFFCESIKECSKSVGMSENSAKVTLHRMRGELRAYLQGKGYEL